MLVQCPIGSDFCATDNFQGIFTHIYFTIFNQEKNSMYELIMYELYDNIIIIRINVIVICMNMYNIIICVN